MFVDIEKIKKSVGMIGSSEKINEMLSMIGQVANTDISVLVTGPSGSGKEMVAKAIHKNSRRKHEKLITVNCAAIPSGTIESELFGHKKGSFTGAIESRKGYFEAAHKGTIFLDEVGELPKEAQSKLLRVIEEGEFIKVGETSSQKVDTRIVAATNKSLEKEVANNNFRQDLYFRLKTINITVPDLKDHPEDIFELVERFSLEFTTKNDIIFKGFESEAIDVMEKYPWPGNIRELKNTVESLLVMNKGKRITSDIVLKKFNIEENYINKNLPIHVDKDADTVERELMLKQLLFLRQDVNDIKQMLSLDKGQYYADDIPLTNPALFLPSSNQKIDSGHRERKEVEDATLYAVNEETIGEVSLSDLEQEIIERTLKKFDGNRRKTAQALNISERTLYRKIKGYDI